MADLSSRSTRWLFPGTLAYGGDYSPEQWPREIWDEDVRLMREAGVNLVSVGIFSWALLQPEEERFDFAWMDDLLDLLHANGISADLATPTASPPAWFFEKYPQARAVDRNGVPMGFGSRGIVSPSSPEYRAAAVRIATELARRHGSHPAVKMWHIHNEYGNPIADEYSDYAESSFRAWLQDRYGSLDALNQAWGTRFWGQYYHQWSQVGVPRTTPTTINPSQRLDFLRFSDWSLRQCFVAEKEAIRTYSDLPVTTNFMANMSWSTDLWEWAKLVDFVSDDHYLDAADPEPQIGLAMAADLTRSLAGGRPWILMEHSTSAVNWQPRNVAKRPGQMIRNSMSHLGRGADAIMFFQWRASRFGSEKFHSAMLPHSGTKSRIWKEVVELGSTLSRIGEVQGSIVRAQVAMLWDFESNWAQSAESQPSVDLQVPQQIRRYYEALWRDNVTVDFVHPSADLSGYKLVVVASQYMMSEEDANNLNQYVESGGKLLVSYYSGIVDRADAVHDSPTADGGFMSVLRPALGVVVEEFLPLLQDQAGSVELDEEYRSLPRTDDTKASQSNSSLWQEDLRVISAKVIGRYVDGPAAEIAHGAPAITLNHAGDGRGYYVSTQLDPDALRAFLHTVWKDAGVTAPDLRAESLEVITRFAEDSGETYDFVINHGDEPALFPCPGVDILRPEESAESPVPAGSVAIYRTVDLPTSI